METPGDGDGTRPARWAVLTCVLALLPDLGAAIPGRSYFFRDFSVTFYPLRLFVARELREGRFPFWNPYIYEGSFALPTLYPVDLLHVLWPGPAAVSWLLTMHLPLAALGMFLLARRVGADPPGATVAGFVYALGGLALSSLNLYVFLQALALAPFLVLLLGRAVAEGGRVIALAAVVLAAAVSTLAVEFVAQALLLALALGLANATGRRSLLRAGSSIALGCALAGLPIAVTAGLLGETVRGSGFEREVALGNAIHPAVLLQTVVPDLFGSLADPVGAWWGGHFFSKGLPYFLSLYLGPLALALAWVGREALEPRARRILLGLSALALWYALGAWGGLASWLASLPGLHAFRFPSKAFFLPHFVVALLAGLGTSRLAAGRGLAGFSRAAVLLALLVGALLVTILAWPAGIASFARMEAAFAPAVTGTLARSAALAFTTALVGALAGVAAVRKLLAPRLATLLVSVLALLDLSRAGAGMNPQVPASFFEPLPELAALGPPSADGGRVFSYGLDYSPAFRELRPPAGASMSRLAFFLNRQILAPYNNILDRAEATEATDLTSFVPRPRELAPEDYAPSRAGVLVPWLRNAGVERVLSLDPLEDPALRLVARVSVPGGPGLHAYALRDPAPRAYVACRVAPASSTNAEALHRVYEPGFDPRADVALERPVPPPSCTRGEALRVGLRPGEERFATEADGDGYLVVRASHARGWRAYVDGRAAEVLRANGKHKAVPLPAGRHDVTLVYEAPGRYLGLGLSVAAFLAMALVLARPPLVGSDDRD